MISRTAVECAVLIEADTIVTDDKTMDATSRNYLMLTTYKVILDGFLSHQFQPKNLEEWVMMRLYQAKSDFSGERLWETLNQVCSNLRTN
jgi:hypothetical protein